jgi:hypothetical protein
MNRLENVRIHYSRVILKSEAVLYFFNNCKSVHTFEIHVFHAHQPAINIAAEFAAFVGNNPNLHTVSVSGWNVHAKRCFQFSFDLILDLLTTTCNNLRHVKLKGCGELSKFTLCRLFEAHGHSLTEVNLQGNQQRNKQQLVSFSYRSEFSGCYKHQPGHINEKDNVEIHDLSLDQKQDSHTWGDVFKLLKPTTTLCLWSCNFVAIDILRDFGEVHGSVWKTLNIYTRFVALKVISDELVDKLRLLYPTLVSVANPKAKH